jgi:hypothetical protein
LSKAAAGAKLPSWNLAWAYIRACDPSAEQNAWRARYQHALTLHRALGARYNETTTLTRIGDTYQATGNLQAARDAWQQALTIFDDLHQPDADQLRAKLATLDIPNSRRTVTINNKGMAAD